MAFYETKNSSAGFRKSFYRCSKDLTFRDHLQTSYELLRVKEGELHVFIENNEYVLKKGQQILILPNLIHSYKSGECGSRSQFIIFSTDYLPEINSEAQGGIFHHPVLDNESFNVFDDLLRYRKDHFLFRSALYRIADYYQKNETISMPVRDNGEFTLWVSEYLEKNCAEHIDEKMLAQKIGYHPRYLSSLINKNFGVSFRTLLNEYRIRLAVELLRDKSKSITDVYMQSGFESQTSFNRNFKAIMKMTPGEYRSRLSLKQ